MKLLTTLYDELHAGRAQELASCLARNAANPAIDAIHVLYDAAHAGGDGVVRRAVRQTNATVRAIHGRPTYGDFFRYANDYLAGDIVVLANADILFNETLQSLEHYQWDGAFLAITRDDFVGTRGEGSSDVWMFRSPIGVFGEGVHFGTNYCDQVISYLALRHGLRVDNPCLSVHCKHMHRSGVRNRPGTREHSPGRSSSSDGLQGMSLRELEQRLIADYGVKLMALARQGGGMIWPSKLITHHDSASRCIVSCRKVIRWQMMRTWMRQVRRSIKGRL